MSLRGGVAEHPPNGGVTLQRNGVTWGDLRRDHDRAVERVLTIGETGQVHLRHQSRTLALSRAWASCFMSDSTTEGTSKRGGRTRDPGAQAVAR
jgi:hypothetical protein